MVAISDEIVETAISFRQKFSISVGDAIIAATAKNYNCLLYTNNASDFKRIQDVKIVVPNLNT